MHADRLINLRMELSTGLHVFRVVGLADLAHQR